MTNSFNPKTTQTPSTTTPSGLNWGAGLIASVKTKQQKRFLTSLSPEELRALPYLFEFWALGHQLPPEGDWRAWVIMGGRGAGKTRAGAEWVRSIAEGATPRAPGHARRIGLIGETFEQARDVMVFGESGILEVSPPDRKPKWVAGRKRLEWANGATAQIYSAFDPESLRGPQFDAVWADELAKWTYAEDAWHMLQFCLRLGAHPRVVVTTTPRNVPTLRALLSHDSTVTTQASTFENSANLASGFLDEVSRLYGGTRLGRQELDGVLLTEERGALWTSASLSKKITREVPHLDRIVVAVDPPVTGHSGSDDCGIIVAGVTMDGPPQDWCGYVLEDATVKAATPTDWARAALAAYHRHTADRIVAEVNQGGDLVESVIRQVDGLVPYKAVRATRGKVARAEPIAALYEQGRIKHVVGLTDLEDQMCLMTMKGFRGQGSPDRVDALVWALFDLMIEPTQHYHNPQVRRL